MLAGRSAKSLVHDRRTQRAKSGASPLRNSGCSRRRCWRRRESASNATTLIYATAALLVVSERGAGNKRE